MKILCFGELLVRLSPPGYERLEEAKDLEFGYAGAEAVCASSLAFQGDDVAMASKVSTNRLGTMALMNLQRYGVDTSHCMRSPERMGLYYSELGRSIRPSMVTYDRQATAMASASCDDFDWDSLLNGVSSFYFSGVVPAISDEIAAACSAALRECKGRGIRTFCDLNYRRGMWTHTRALETWSELMPYVDVLTASEDDLDGIYQGVRAPEETAEAYYSRAADYIMTEMGCERMAYVVREIDEGGLAVFKGTMLSDENRESSRHIPVAVEDLSGCGSLFCASVIHGMTRGWAPKHVIEYATMASAYKATILGDYGYATEVGIERLLSANDPAIIQ